MASFILPWMAENVARKRGGNGGIVGQGIQGLGRYKNQQSNAAPPDAPGTPPGPAGDGGEDAPYDGADPISGLDGSEGFAGGQIVTKPTVARLAEHGQPEMVVPLNPPVGARVRPDMMMRYQRYRG